MDRSTSITRDDGYILAFTAILIIPLCVFTAFAIDVGSWWAQAGRLQHMADTASLAAVVYLPDEAAARVASESVVKANWRSELGPAPKCGTATERSALTCERASANSWRVEVTGRAVAYFANAIGVTHLDITRGSTAAYTPPLPLGSPTNAFGNNLPPGCTDPVDCGTTSVGLQPYLWASIAGAYEAHRFGDFYASRCWGDSNVAGDTCVQFGASYPGTNPTYTGTNNKYNPYYRPDGYLYNIDVHAPGYVTVELYDPECNTKVGGGVPHDGSSTDVHTCETQVHGTEFLVYQAASSELASTSDPTQEPGNLAVSSTGTTCNHSYLPAASGAGVDSWTTLCTFYAPNPAKYALRVRNDDISGTTCRNPVVLTPNACVGRGRNNYAIRARMGSSTRDVNVYGVGDIGIYTGFPGSTAEFYLANVTPVYADKDLIVSWADPGDGFDDSTWTMTLLPPNHLTVPCDYWTSVDPAGNVQKSPVTHSVDCALITRQAGVNRFDNKWVHMKVSLIGYTDSMCPVASAECWWKVRYELGGSPNDKTIFAARVTGDPVRISG